MARTEDGTSSVYTRIYPKAKAQAEAILGKQNINSL